MGDLDDVLDTVFESSEQKYAAIVLRDPERYASPENADALREFLRYEQTRADKDAFAERWRNFQGILALPVPARAWGSFYKRLRESEPPPPRNNARKRRSSLVDKDESEIVYEGGRTWIEVVNDDNTKEATRLMAINFINDRIGYYNNMYMMITAYMQARGIAYKPPHEYTWKFYADGIYDAMLQRSRARFDWKHDDAAGDDEAVVAPPE